VNLNGVGTREARKTRQDRGTFRNRLGSSEWGGSSNPMWTKDKSSHLDRYRRNVPVQWDVGLNDGRYSSPVIRTS
jgi:hypothetical protein